MGKQKNTAPHKNKWAINFFGSLVKNINKTKIIENPIDSFLFPEARKQHTLEVQQHPKTMAAWKQYENDQSTI